MGRRFVLSKTEEDVLVDALQLAAKWGCPFEVHDIRIIVRDYLNSIPRQVSEFVDNTPSDDWVRAFIKRHAELRLKFAENIKRSRAEVSRETISKYFDELKRSLNNDVPASNVVNYDETCFVDDPQKSKVKFIVQVLLPASLHLVLPLLTNAFSFL